MDGCTAINFVKNMSKMVLSRLALFVLHDDICGSFHNKATINAYALLVYYDKTWKKTVLTCITKIIAEQPSLTQSERPMYHMKEK